MLLIRSFIIEGYRGVYVMSRTDKGRSVYSSRWAVKPVALGLSLLLTGQKRLPVPPAMMTHQVWVDTLIR